MKFISLCLITLACSSNLYAYDPKSDAEYYALDRLIELAPRVVRYSENQLQYRNVFSKQQVAEAIEGSANLFSDSPCIAKVVKNSAAALAEASFDYYSGIVMLRENSLVMREGFATIEAAKAAEAGIPKAVEGFVREFSKCVQRKK